MDNISVLSWNVRGLNMRARRDVVRLLVDDVKASLVCLQETKLQTVTRDIMLSMLGTQFEDYAYLLASETRGGVLIAARRQDASISDVQLGCFSITVRICTQAEGLQWWLTSVYGPQANNEKELFLEELEAVRDACPGPWLVVGVG